MSVLYKTGTARFWHYFEEICKIPHGSGNMTAISDYCADFAKEHNLKYYQDENKNVIIYKDAYPGYENAEPVILQGHLDMVCEKNPDYEFDFTKDSLRLVVEEGKLWAEGTTLGADDGVAVCFMLSILEDNNIKAPALQCVFTVDEEIGMLGASALDMSKITARKMINLDNGEEDFMLIGCAGGVTAICHLPLNTTVVSGVECIVEVSGLAGGHSGETIHEERANANVLLGRTLYDLSKKNRINIIEANGGLKDNAIPRMSKATIVIDSDSVKQAIADIERLEQIYIKEYASTDENLLLTITVNEKTVDVNAFDDDSTMRMIAVMFNLPNGIQKMSKIVSGQVRSSLNMGILKSSDNECIFSFSVRSDFKSEKDEMCNRIEALMKLAGGRVVFEGEYPAWEAMEKSELQEIMVQTYEDCFGKIPVVGTIHAGLECGIFSDALKGLDCVSIGPTMKNIHTSSEMLDIYSTERYMDYLLTVLERIK